MKKIMLFLAMGVACSLFAGRVTFHCTVNKKDAVFKTGEEIVFTAKILEDKKPAVSKKLGYRLMYDKKAVKCGLVDGTETLTFKVKADKPGWVYLKLYSFGDSKDDLLHVKRVSNPKLYVRASKEGGIGAVVAPETFRHGKDEPADFDKFWNNVKKELAAVPVKLLESKPIPQEVITKARVQKPENYVFSDIKIQCAGGMPVSGYLTIPTNAKKGTLPAMVTYHGAGVRSARLHAGDVAHNIIVLDVNAHGIENSRNDAYYQKLHKEVYTKNGVGSYPFFGMEDRNTYYFKGMFMRVLRALDYVKSLPEWDGKTLIVSGGSQGGIQVLVACALDHDITLAKAKVPALSDHFALKFNRRPGWPQIFEKIPAEKVKKVENCLSYYDGVFFAKRVKCPIYLYTGFIDTTCPPTGVFAVLHNIPATTPKHLFHVPTAGHSVPENGSPFGDALLKHIGKAK